MKIDGRTLTHEASEAIRRMAVRRASDNALLLSISYDAVGRRVSSTDYLAAGDPCGGPPALTRHVYAGLETLEERLSCDGGTSYAMAREFVWGDRFPQPVALITHGGTGGFGGPAVPAGESVYHYLHDVLGSVVAMTDPAGQVVERYTYDPYGKTVIEATNPATGLPTTRLEASAFGNPFAWTGQRYDAGVRLYHFLFRGYSPMLGRWLQRDELGYVDGVSLYGYARCSPLVWFDPLGLEIVYTGDPEHQKKCKKQVEDLKKKDPKAKHLIEDLEKSKHKHRIGPRKAGRGNETRYDDTEKSQKEGEGCGSEVCYDPDAAGKDANGDTIPPEVRLMHELGHANDADKGTRRPPNETNEHGVKSNEETAVGAENWVRDDYGLQPRNSYEGKPLTPREPPLSKPPSTQPGSQPSSGPSKP